jgi:A/G-specific adenine glycosylase
VGREAEARATLLRWYRGNARDLPFRRTRDPYRILVSEVALQQTRIEQGLPFLERFFERFPTVQALAAASEEDVLLAWEGLGYYRRARALRAAAIEIVAHHGGKVPPSYDALLALPGVGPYTAGAVASTAFGARAPAVDGNAARVLSRLFMIADDASTPSGLRTFQERALSWMGKSDPSAFNQALMELGATLCRPASPRCGECPVARACGARREDAVEDYPMRAPSAPLPEVEVAFAVVERQGRVLAVRRGKKGLLAGLWALPGGEVRESESPRETLGRHLAGFGLSISELSELDQRRKVFSSRVWDARVYRCAVEGSSAPLEHARWFSPADRAKVPFVPFQREILDGLNR